MLALSTMFYCESPEFTHLAFLKLKNLSGWGKTALEGSLILRDRKGLSQECVFDMQTNQL